MKRLFGFLQIIMGICSIVYLVYISITYTSDIFGSDEYLYLLPLGLLSIVLIIFGILFIKEDNNDAVKDSYYISVKTKFKGTREDSGSENLPSYCYIITSWVNPSDNKLYLFKSEDVGYGNGKIIEDMGISEFIVNYNYYNIKDYKMDVDYLLERLKNEKNR